MYERMGRSDVNIVCMAGDGSTVDAGFQSLSATAERNEKMLYLCYDNEGYMNTGYQRSSTTSLGSRTSTTSVGPVINGKRQHQKYVPVIMAMHGLEYCATASSSNMADMIRKIEKARQAVQCNLFPLWEKDENCFMINYVNKSPLTVREFVSGIG